MVIQPAVLAAAVALAGSTAPGSAVAATTSHDQLRIDGEQRRYRLFTPSAHGRSRPLVVVLHGGGKAENGDTIAGATRFDEQAERRGWVVAYPTALRGTFHAGSCCGRRPGSADDVRFVRRLVARLRARHGVDPRRVFAVGFSNGGFMAYRLACEASELVAGIAAVAATETVRRCRPRRAVSVLHVHGSEDERVRYDGGFLGDPDAPGARALAARWRGRDGCDGPVDRTVLGAATTESATGCRGGVRVTLTTLAGVPHEWPGARPPYGRSVVAFDATAAIAGFLASVPARR